MPEADNRRALSAHPLSEDPGRWSVVVGVVAVVLDVDVSA